MDRNLIVDTLTFIFSGQARKSLWIETKSMSERSAVPSVRLVRACGSKQILLRWSLAAVPVRLVRACGSKLLLYDKDIDRNRSGS